MFLSKNRAILAAFLATFFALGVGPLMAQAGGDAAIPVYPGATATARPTGVGLKRPPPPSAKTYATSDSFAKVKAWYRTHLNGAQELQQPGMEKTEDAFLVGNAQSGGVVMIESYNGKTWIIIGPPV